MYRKLLSWDTNLCSCPLVRLHVNMSCDEAKCIKCYNGWSKLPTHYFYNKPLCFSCTWIRSFHEHGRRFQLLSKCAFQFCFHNVYTYIYIYIVMIKFIVADIILVYNMNEPYSTYWLTSSDLKVSCECYLTVISFLKKARLEASSLDSRDFTKPISHPESMKQLVKKPLDKAHLNWVVKIGITLPKEKQVKLLDFLRKDISWVPTYEAKVL